MSVERQPQVPHPWEEFPQERPQHPRQKRWGLEKIPKSEILFLTGVNLWKRLRPGDPVNVSAVGRYAGMNSRQLSRQLYNRLASEYILPPKRGYRSGSHEQRSSTIERDQKVARLWSQGLSGKQISYRLKGKSVHSSLDRLRKRGKIESRAKAPIPKERLEVVKRLRRQGKTYRKIAEITGESWGKVSSARVKLVERREIEITRRIRSKEELVAYDAQVKRLRDEEHLTNKQIAQRTSTTIHLVKNSINGMLRKGEIKRKMG